MKLTSTLLTSVVVILFVGACKSTQSVAEPVDAVTCSECKTTWVSLNDDGESQIYSLGLEERITTCEDCRSVVRTFFATGKWEHTCTACGDALVHCKVHREIGLTRLAR